MYIVRELLTKEPKKKGTQVSKALRFFNNVTRQNSIAFILSDFIDANYQDALRVAARKHDIIGIKVYDKMDMELPKAGMLQVQDAEDGDTKWIDSNNDFVRHSYQQEFFRVTAYSTEDHLKKPVAIYCTFVPVMIMSGCCNGSSSAGTGDPII